MGTTFPKKDTYTFDDILNQNLVEQRIDEDFIDKVTTMIDQRPFSFDDFKKLCDCWDQKAMHDVWMFGQYCKVLVLAKDSNSKKSLILLGGTYAPMKWRYRDPAVLFGHAIIDYMFQKATNIVVDISLK